MNDPRLKDELQGTTVEPLLPIEKTLIAWSLGIGVTLLVLLAIAGRYLPVG